MRSICKRRSVQNTQSGYALVMIMFFLALLVLSTVTAAPTVLSTIQRDREEEMVWRGKQYVRGIKLYYMKMHRFPTSLEDLTKPKTGIRFMRQEYKDPMNKVDGTWRLIYVGPNGQLIGSLMNRSLGFGGQTAGPFGGQAGNAAGGTSSLFNTGATGLGGGSSFNSGGSVNQFGSNTPGGATTTALQNASSPTDPNAQNPGTTNDSSQPQPIGGTFDASNTVGGNIIGVGSKVDRKSFRWYEKAKNYKQFEFIWDPSKDRMMGGATRGIGTPIQNGIQFGTPSPTTAPGVPIPGPAPNQGLSPDPGNNPPLQAPPANP